MRVACERSETCDPPLLPGRREPRSWAARRPSAGRSVERRHPAESQPFYGGAVRSGSAPSTGGGCVLLATAPRPVIPRCRRAAASLGRGRPVGRRLAGVLSVASPPRASHSAVVPFALDRLQVPAADACCLRPLRDLRSPAAAGPPLASVVGSPSAERLSSNASKAGSATSATAAGL
jgi:hypothetical protein